MHSGLSTDPTATHHPAAAVLRSARVWIVCVRAALGYDKTARILGCSWFVILALSSAQKIFIQADSFGIPDFSPAAWPALLSSLCLLVFYLALGWLIIHRAAPVARTHRMLPTLTAFAGCYLPWTIPLVGPSAVSVEQNVTAAALLLAGTLSMVAVIGHLGRSFSIVPQARRLIRTGPYAIVRHPLYLAEEIALSGVLLQFLSPLTLALFLLHGVLQVRRMFYEEALLRRSIRDYDDYARMTPRLIPYIW